MNRVVQELNNLKDLSIGLTELMKLLPDYDEALEKMKQNLKEQKEQEEKQKE